MLTKVSGKALSAYFISEKTAQKCNVSQNTTTKPTWQSPSIDVKAIEGVNFCCLTIAKCQNDTIVTKMGKPFLMKTFLNEGQLGRIYTTNQIEFQRVYSRTLPQTKMDKGNVNHRTSITKFSFWYLSSLSRIFRIFFSKLRSQAMN